LKEARKSLRYVVRKALDLGVRKGLMGMNASMSFDETVPCSSFDTTGLPAVGPLRFGSAYVGDLVSRSGAAIVGQVYYVQIMNFTILLDKLR